MKTKSGSCLRWCACLLGLGLSALLVGCQTAGNQVSTETGCRCRLCETRVRTAAIKGFTYREHVCTVCRKSPDSHLWPEAPELSAPVGAHDCQAGGVLCQACDDDSFPVRAATSAGNVATR